MKSIIAALLFGALAIVATPTTASAKPKPGKTYNWIYQVVSVKADGQIHSYKEETYVLKSSCEATAKKRSKGWVIDHVCIRKQP